MALQVAGKRHRLSLVDLSGDVLRQSPRPWPGFPTFSRLGRSVYNRSENYEPECPTGICSTSAQGVALSRETEAAFDTQELFRQALRC